MNKNNFKQYNDKYKNIIYKGYHRRLYNELTTNNFDALYSETQIKIIELIERFNLKIFYIECLPKTSYKLKFIDNNFVDIYDKNVLVLKNLLKKDIFHLYKNELFEVLYKIPYLDNNGYYYYNILILVKDENSIKEINRYNFNTINIKNVTPINKEQITFDFIESSFKDKNDFNDCILSVDENNYKWNLISNSEYIEKYCNGDNEKFDIQEYFNITSYIDYKNFDNNSYAMSCFRLLDMGIYSFDRYYIKEINEKGSCIIYVNRYDMNSGFITNFDELVGGVQVNFNKNNFNTENVVYTYSSLYDNIVDQCIVVLDFDRRWIKTGFIDFDALEIYNKNDIWEGVLKKDI